jgi:hypothetical protein
MISSKFACKICVCDNQLLTSCVRGANPSDEQVTVGQACREPAFIELRINLQLIVRVRMAGGVSGPGDRGKPSFE